MGVFNKKQEVVDKQDTLKSWSHNTSRCYNQVLSKATTLDENFKKVRLKAIPILEAKVIKIIDIIIKVPTLKPQRYWISK